LAWAACQEQSFLLRSWNTLLEEEECFQRALELRIQRIQLGQEALEVQTLEEKEEHRTVRELPLRVAVAVAFLVLQEARQPEVPTKTDQRGSTWFLFTNVF
jgi:hypothetical protein